MSGTHLLRYLKLGRIDTNPYAIRVAVFEADYLTSLYLNSTSKPTNQSSRQPYAIIAERYYMMLRV